MASRSWITELTDLVAAQGLRYSAVGNCDKGMCEALTAEFNTWKEAMSDHPVMQVFLAY
jgi:hypothetical protein